MMWLFTFWILMAMLHWTMGQIESPTPNCAVSCWENTKYVSKCLDDDVCRCSEPEYQTSLFQCLYSQCDAAQFGSALQHSILQCSGIGGEIILSIPRSPNQDALRRREAEYLAGTKAYGSGSGSAAGFPTQSANYPMQSVNDYATQSVALSYSPDATASSQPPYFPLTTATGPAMSSATPTGASSAVTTATARPVLYTGPAPAVGCSITAPILITIAALLWAL